ncbi:hypothetical protein ACFVFQ_09855 [Streptomyces sp. NPDC057743]|uniref:hypothetical protein n=1 Tax=Streptomyces sp. NPDC057743 TaxID=3346236 RepID=UPI0036AFA275
MRKDTGKPGIRPRIPAACRLPLTALVVVLTFLLGAAAPACAARSAPPAAAAPGAKTASAANTNSEEEKHSKRETERSRPRRLTPAAEGVPATRRPLPPCLSGASGDDGTPARSAAAPDDPRAARPAQLPLLHCVFRC